MEQVQSSVVRIAGILGEPELQGDIHQINERRRQLWRTVSSLFDFVDMAKRSLGTHWQHYPARQKEFVSAFGGFVEAFYVDVMQFPKNQKILYARERVDTDFAEVDTVMAMRPVDTLPIQYRLHFIGSEWTVYDLHIHNISLVNNFRYQFNRILSAGAFDDLLKSLQEKKPEWIRPPTSRPNWGVSFLLFAGGRALDIRRLEEK
jgi:phospholipid transport system substrate-binding protein